MKAGKVLFISLALILTAGILTSMSINTFSDGVSGKGDVVEDPRNVDEFTDIKIGGAFSVYLTQSETGSENSPGPL